MQQRRRGQISEQQHPSQPDSTVMLMQVMKMAVRYKRKAMTFVSSVGVAMSLGKTGVKEDSLGTNIAEEFPGSDGYAVG